MKKSTGLIDRETLLCHAKLLVAKDSYSHEDAARVRGLLDLADRLGTNSGEARSASSGAETRALERLMGVPERRAVPESEKRDMLESGLPFDSLATSILVPQEYAPFNVALKAYDQLFDDSFTTHFTGFSGRPLRLPSLDDTSSASSIVGEATQDTEHDPSFSNLNLPAAPTWRSPEIKISNETLQDAPADMALLLTAAMALRHARGIGANLVSTLTTAAPVAVTATGSSKNTGGAETGGTSIGTTDLINLRTSVNPAYRSSGRAAWVMNDNTLASIEGLLDKNGSLIFRPEYDANGNRILLGFKVCLSPSMPSIGLSGTPIAFGDLSRFIVRRGHVSVSRLFEKYAEYDISAFRSWTRCNGTLLIPTGGDSPVKLLQNAAS